MVITQLDLGLRIRRARERIGMSQEALADATHRNQKAISEYETGKRKLPAIEIPEFAVVLEVPVSYFFEGDVQVEELDHMLLQEFHAISSLLDKKAAIQVMHIFASALKRQGT